MEAATRVARQLARGDSAVEVAAAGGSGSRELLAALREVRDYLDERSKGAAAMAGGDLSVRVTPRAETDSLGQALRKLSGQLQELARVANRIEEGDHAVALPRLSAGNNFGTAFATMTLSLLQQLDVLTASERGNRQLAQTLASARQRLEHLLASSPAMIYSRAANAYADFTFISKNVTKQLGYAVEDLLMPGFWAGRVHPEDVTRGNAELARGLAASFGNFEYRFQHQDGSYRWMRDGFQLIRDAAGQPLELIGWWIDVTDQKQSQGALLEIEGQLRQAHKMEAIGTLAGGVAHDFNNLLTVIRGGTELLLESVTGENQRTEVIEIQKAADRAAKLTRQLLAFSRKQVLRSEVLDLNEVVSDLLHMLQRLLVNDAITLKLERSPGTPAVCADRGQLEQVVVNLVVNARDALPHGGAIGLRITHIELGAGGPGPVTLDPGPYVLLSVEDTGTGMDLETQARIFEPFFTTKEKGKGTGLGLATVYGIVRQSGGDIALQSTPGKGTTFSIYLPVEGAAAPSAPRGAVTATLQTGSEAILLVDDEDAVRSLVGKVLQRKGYHVYQAQSGQEALKLFTGVDVAFDLVITDLAMPEMSGRELAQHVHELKPDTRILYVSGYAYADAELGETDAPGEQAYLQKPFSVEQLALKVREVLDAA